MPEHDPLLAWREQFSILDRTTYMISNSLGAMPAAARDAATAYLDQWDQRGVRAWEEAWLGVVTGVGNRIAPILGVPTGTVSMHQNVTLASAVVRSCFDWRAARNRIVFTELNFPSIMYLYHETTALGAEVVVVPAAEDGITVDLERLLEAIDERTALVAVSHVLFRSASIQDAKAICERARAVGARVSLDVYQSVGVMPLQIGAWGADFAVGGCLKWLCGGPGNAFLYVREDLHRELAPRLTGWMASARPFGFEPRLERSESILGFLNGTPNVPGHAIARPGIEIVNEIGPIAIREKSMRQTQRIMDRAQALGIDAPTPADPAARGGTVTLSPPDAEAISRGLLAEEILVDFRPNAGIRLSPHFYNTDEECDRAVDRIAELCRVPAKP